MAGILAVLAEAPPLRRAGNLSVVVDGHKVGPVRQGEVAEFTVEPGPHSVRVTAGGNRSNAVAVTVTDGERCRIVSSSTGLGLVAIVPLLGLILMLIPGSIFRLRPHVQRRAPAPAGQGSSGHEGGSTGLWWESDPVLAKRYRKGQG
ncbi:hypothetical protein GA0115240_172021 [Streptomyces sp. DvalAA-14]|nr:hypothetical protein GA0115240_172021 [Streptomyces sp. DvalAA-14]